MANRREILKSGAIITGVALATSSCYSKPKNNSEPINMRPIIGHNNHKYSLDKSWGIQDPSKYPVHHCHEMVMDKSGRLLMTTTDVKNNILIYNKDGKIVESWTGDWPAAHGLTINDEGGTEYLYVTDPESKFEVCKTTLDGRKLLNITFPKEAEIYESADQFRPTETAIAANGDIYVADGYGKSYIIVFDSSGKYKFHFGGKGDGDDQFDCPHGITIDDRNGKTPELLITSRSKNEFKRFTMDGKHIQTIKMPGYFMCRPVIKGDYIYFAILATESWWAYDGMVAILDLDYNVVSLPGSAHLPSYTDGIIGRPAHDGTSFLNPHDVCIDDSDNIYVPQWYSGKTYPYRLERV